MTATFLSEAMFLGTALYLEENFILSLSQRTDSSFPRYIYSVSGASFYSNIFKLIKCTADIVLSRHSSFQAFKLHALCDYPDQWTGCCHIPGKSICIQQSP